MAWVHGKNTEILVNSIHDVSDFANTSTFTRTADSHDVTPYGKNAHEFEGGLFNGSFTMGGTYDNTVDGTPAVLDPLVGTLCTIRRRPEGSGVGKPQQVFEALLTDYTETSPAADMVTWAATFQLSGDVVKGDAGS